MMKKSTQYIVALLLGVPVGIGVLVGIVPPLLNAPSTMSHALGMSIVFWLFAAAVAGAVHIARTMRAEQEAQLKEKK